VTICPPAISRTYSKSCLSTRVTGILTLNFEGGMSAAAAVSRTAGANRSGCKVEVRYVKSN